MSEIDDLRGRREDIYEELGCGPECEACRALNRELDDIEGRLERLGEKL